MNILVKDLLGYIEDFKSKSMHNSAQKEKYIKDMEFLKNKVEIRRNSNTTGACISIDEIAKIIMEYCNSIPSRKLRRSDLFEKLKLDHKN